MAKKRSVIFVCENCGNEYSAWQGRCQACGSWNTLKEVSFEEGPSFESGIAITPQTLEQVSSQGLERIISNISEFDRVLGGGIVRDSIILLGGDPGVGKSTLLLEVIESTLKNSKIPKENLNNFVLYISGEESVNQLKIRAGRLGIKDSPINFLNETNLPNIIASIQKLSPKLVIVDSIQTMYHPRFPSTAGSIVQVRECSFALQQLAKKQGIAIVLVGHITKEGVVAGPKTLEHLVDAVLYLEGDRYHKIRILRSVKNRFGDVFESGLFEMTDRGLQEITNPTAIFLGEKIIAPGSVITATLEGRRPILIEIQALVKRTVFGYPKRATSGYDVNRLQLLLAVLDKRAAINLENNDVYLNIVGGVKIKEPAVDLAVLAAITSAFKNIALDEKLVIFGEVGLVGEIRKVILEEERESEIKRLGYLTMIKSKTIKDFLSKYF